MGHQSFFVRLQDSLARRVRAVLDAPNAGYASLDELVAVAILNQLNMDASAEDGLIDPNQPIQTMQFQQARASKFEELPLVVAVDLTRHAEQYFKRPPAEPPLALVEPPDASDQRLFSLTNRLSQLKVSTRVCANLALKGEWPDQKEFQTRAASTARAIGRLLRGDADTFAPVDRDQNGRLHVGYPIGDDEDKACARFINSFTISNVGEKVSGPLAILGLANVVDGSVGLTEAGWRLASSASPLPPVRETDLGNLLSPDEAAELRSRLRDAAAEYAAIREFLRDVRRADGVQSRVDEFLNRQYPEWNQSQVIAHRAAMVGRLSDVDVLQSKGRGVSAIIELLPAAQEFTH